MRAEKGKNLKEVKIFNRRLLLKLVCTQKSISRIQLAHRTGMSKMTVSNLVSELCAEGYIRDDSRQTSAKTGPKPKNLVVSPSAPKLIGIAVRRKRIGAVTATLDFNILSKEYVAFEESADEAQLKSIIFALIERQLKECGGSAVGIGITSPGPLDNAAGVIFNPPRLFSGKDFAVVKAVEERFGLPTRLEKDTFGAATAEMLWGGDTVPDDLLYVSFASGIGACIVEGKKIYQPHSSFSGEIGHMAIVADGRSNDCGNSGYLESYCSAALLTNEVNKALGTDYNFSECVARFSEPAVRDIFYRQSEYLALALVNMVNILNPSLIVLGDRGSEFPAELFEFLKDRINAKCFAAPHQKVNILPSRFGRDPSLFGAAAIVAAELFSND